MEPPESPPRTSFSSLPCDIALDIVARVSRFQHPTLSLVCKRFRSLLSSPELHVGKKEARLYLCLNLNNNIKPNNNILWFTLSPIPERQKLIPIPSFPHRRHPQSSTVVSTGSEIYLIGGYIKNKRTNLVLLFDCRSNQWRRLPNMRVARASSKAGVIDGKIYVTGGSSLESEDYGEVYDPRTQTWELLSPSTSTLDLNLTDKLNCYCYVEIDKNIVCQIRFGHEGRLCWRNANGDDLEWRVLRKRYKFSPDNFVSVVSSGRKVTVWWKKVEKFRHIQGHDFFTERFTTEIWCAEISFEKSGSGGELWAIIDWSKSVYTFDGGDSNFFLHSAIVTL